MEQIIRILDRLLDPVGRALDGPAARALLSLRADEESQSRIDELATRCNQGTLTPAERAEYESLIAVAGVIAVLQAKARATLSTSPAA